MSEFNFNGKHSLWVEKYRPVTVEDCILPERIKNTFREYVKTGDFPHVLLAGGAGIGKTTLARALCHDLDIDTMMINVSNERGIDVLRTKIADFATTVSFSGGLKCIILDEFDGATEILQKALRAAMEEYSINCRFALTCNYPNRIIDAIHSRSTVIDLEIRNDEKIDMCKQFMKRLESILKNEEVEYEKKALVALIAKNFPDFRRTINELQALSQTGITVDAVAEMNQEVSITKLTKSMREKNFKDVRQWVANNSNSDPNILFRKLYDSLYDTIQPASIPEVIVILAQYQHYAVTAIDPEINLCACFIEIMAVAEFI